MTKEELVLTSTYNITASETDVKARLRLGALINLLIHSAYDSADRLGFGYKGVREQQLYWVLSRMTVEIYKPMKWYQDTVVDTWPKDIDSLLYLRDYQVKDKEQNDVARCTSGWLAIDIETKRPKKVNAIYADIFTQLKDKHGLTDVPEKLPAVTEGEKYEITAQYFDLDLNKHVTTSRYIDWMLDTLPLDFHLNNYPKRLAINFLRETMIGDKIQLIKSQTADNQFSFEGINLTKNTNAFRAKIDF